MRYFFRYIVQSSPEIAAELAAMSVKVKPSGYIGFNIDEADPHAMAIASWAHRRHIEVQVGTRLEPADLVATDWLELLPDWLHGYPQPDEGEFGYLRATYDLSAYCEACGVGLRQVAPFQMKGEPPWGRRSILQLNWVFGECFVTPETWETTFKPFGVGRRPVTDRRHRELTTVVQLVVEELVDVDGTGRPVETCLRCGVVKIQPISSGFFPALRGVPVGAVCRTRQWFGSGAEARQPILVSQELRRAMIRDGVRGASFRPVASRTA